MINFDKVLGFHSQALKLRGKRSELIANNLANVDTPNYKAQDLDFKSAIKQFSGKSITMTGDKSGHFSVQNDPFGSMAIRFRDVAERSIDGNTVDKEVETVAFAKNAIDYQTSLTYLNGSISALRKAIKGE